MGLENGSDIRETPIAYSKSRVSKRWGHKPGYEYLPSSPCVLENSDRSCIGLSLFSGCTERWYLRVITRP